MKGKYIYLDQNVLFEYLGGDNTELIDAILMLKRKNHFIYSPAHMEELAIPFMGNNSKEVKDRVLKEIIGISELTGNKEVFPGFANPMHITSEHPSVCFKRVIDSYDRNPMLEQGENEQLQQYKKTDIDGKKAQKISILDSSILLQEEHSSSLNGRFHLDLFAAMSARVAGLKDFKYPEILKSHVTFERCIEITFFYLEGIRYSPEAIKKSRSRMHDVSHAIYASTADIIVTDDKKFSKKIKAVYKYWGIKTEVYSSSCLINKVESPEMPK